MTTRRRKSQQDTNHTVAMAVTLILVMFAGGIGTMYDGRLDSTLVLFGIACFIGAYMVWES